MYLWVGWLYLRLIILDTLVIIVVADHVEG